METKLQPQIHYRGRLAPTPTGYLHLGHAATFRVAWQRARSAGGTLLMRIEDLDTARCREEFARAALEDLRAEGLDWDEEPYYQSQRGELYRAAWEKLKNGGWIYPCTRSRKDVAAAGQAPHEGESETIYPVEWRPVPGTGQEATTPEGVNWRWRVPEGESVEFTDGRCGLYSRVAGVDFGDFVVWRREGGPAYELAVVVDDIAMGMTEVVRGEDLLLSTCRQLLIYRALGARPPDFYHTPLVRDAQGNRLAKRSEAMSLRARRKADNGGT